MSITELAQKTRLSGRAVRNAVGELTRSGELEVLSGGSGRGNRTAYQLPVKVADSATFEPETRQNLPPLGTGNPAESATFNGHSPSPPDTSAQVSELKAAKSATFDTSDDLKGSVVSGRRSRSSSRRKPQTKPERPDVERLCAHLAERVTANGSRPPSIGQKWRDAARLLIDKDGMTEQQVMAAIDWSQKDEFWHRNILSMPTLRAQYDKLRLAALAEQRKKTQPHGRANPDDEYAEAMQRIQARKEHLNGTRGDSDNRPPRQVSLPPAAN